jgi:hypothetical protein
MFVLLLESLFLAPGHFVVRVSVDCCGGILVGRKQVGHVLIEILIDVLVVHCDFGFDCLGFNFKITIL